MKTSHSMRSHIAALGLAVSASCLVVSSATAGGFAINEQSAYGLGTAYAGVAAGGTLSTTFWNPAGLGEVGKWDYEGDITAILPFVSATATTLLPAGQQHFNNVGIGAAVPASYSAYRINQNIILGLNINSPFGLATSWGNGSNVTLSGAGYGSRVFTLNVNPNIAYQFNDQLTIAAGVQGQYMDLRESGFGVATGDYIGKTKSIGFGYTLGVDWKPLKGTSLGVGYRSGIDNTLKGTLYGVTPVGLDGTLKIKTPGMLTMGVSQDLNEFWTLKGGVTWTNWSVLNSVPVSGAAALPVTALLGSPSIPFKYRDSWMYSVGGEYKYRPDLTLRAGFAYEVSPITTATRTFRLPDSDRLWFTAGLSYAPSKVYSFDVGYAFLHGLSTNIGSALTGGPVLNESASATYSSNVHIISVALKVKLDQVFGPGPL